MVEAVEIEPAIIAVLGGDAPLVVLELVAANQRRVDHEVGVAQRGLAVERPLEAEVGPDLGRIARGQAIYQIEAFGHRHP